MRGPAVSVTTPLADLQQQFAAQLAQITDEDERRKMVRQLLLDAANQATDEVLKPKAPIRTAREYLASKIELPPILVGTEKYVALVRGGLSVRIGRAGKGKTVGTLNQLIRWSAGLPWLDDWTDSDGEAFYAPEKPLKCLVIENEGAGGLFHKQLGTMFYAENYLTPKDREVALENFLVWGDGGYAGLKFDDDEKLKWVRAGLEEYEPDLVFVEPFRGLWNGDENSSTDMGKVADAMVEMASDFKCAVLLSHHERKSGVGDDGEAMSAGRGSTVLEGVVTTMENFVVVHNGDYRELSQSKNRHSKSPPPVRLEWDGDAWWYRHVPEEDIAQSIIAALQDSEDPMNVGDLSELTGEKVAKVREVCKRLKDENQITALGSSQLPGGKGSTGVRYRLPYEANTGGLSV